MTPRGAQLLDEAGRAIAAARDELDTQGAAVAAQTASAAMLTLAQACLDLDGLAPNGTAAVCIAYGEQFARTRRLYSAYHRWLLDWPTWDGQRAARSPPPSTRIPPRRPSNEPRSFAMPWNGSWTGAPEWVS